MGTRELFGGLFFALVALGGGAMTQVGPNLFPEYANLVFYLGLGALGIGLFGIIAMIIFREKKPTSAPERP